MALKVAIIRVNEDDPNDMVVLIQDDLLTELVAETRRLSKFGFKRRNEKKVGKAVNHVINVTKQRTINLP